MNQLFEEINNIIAEWNPLEVDSFIAEDEYRGYIPFIIQELKKGSSSSFFLERFLQIIGLNFNPMNLSHKAEIEIFHSKLTDVYLKYK